MGLTIIGLGVNNGDISLNALNKIRNSDYVIVRTEKTPSTDFLKELNIPFISLDCIYQKSRNFDTLTKNLAKEVLEYLKKGDVCYLVDGAVSQDSSSKILLEKVKGTTVFEGVSKADFAMSSCGVFSTSYTAVSAYDNEIVKFSLPLVVYDLDSQILACEWKLKLMDLIGDEQKVWLYIDKQPKKVELFEIDRFSNYDFSTCLIIEKTEFLQQERYDFYDLYNVVKMLRAPNGCPWDRVQTMDTVRKNLIEECYELADAIDQKADDKILEEIGDVMLQAVFHMMFAEERSAFSVTDVFTDECKKLIFRHSHIFGNDVVSSSEGALDVWDKNKRVEKGFDTAYQYISDVPKCFPGLLRAQKTLKRISKYTNNSLTEEQVVEQIVNVAKNCDANSCGDLLLLTSYLLQLRGVEAEEALYFAVDRLVASCKTNDGENFPLGDYLKHNGN